MTRTRTVLAATAVGALLAVPVACSSDDDTTTTDTSATATSTGAETTVGDVTISGAWARPTTPGTTTSAVYLELTSTEGDALLGVSVPADVAADAQIHETTTADGDMGEMDDMGGSDTTMGAMTEDSVESMDDMAGDARDAMDDMGSTDTSMGGAASGEMTMTPVDRIDLPAGETAALEPGGYHIMLLDVVEPLADGDEIQVTLTFEKAGETTITVPVGTP